MRTIKDTIVVTGAAGFIGSRLAHHLNLRGFENLILVDDFGEENKAVNLSDLTYALSVDRDQFFNWLSTSGNTVDFIFHLGARTDTTEFDHEVHRILNFEYSQKIWDHCAQRQIPLVYASSAATYGAGEFGYADDHSIIPDLRPLNPYGESKNDFDIWVLQQITTPPFWAGLKFFNVYGPNEYHKGRMASVIWHAFNQVIQSGEVKLFRSHRPDFKDGEQLRDFIYVQDVLKVCFWLMRSSPESAIYNVGTGRARTFADLARATFSSMGKETNIRFIDMPEDIREKYQYFTEASMSKLTDAGYREPFYSLEDGIADYVRQYLVKL